LRSEPTSKSRTSNQQRAGDHALATKAACVLDAHAKHGEALCLGLSGGVDSVALLDILVRLAPSRRWTLTAVHINHQLNPRAGAWARFCARLCRGLHVPFKTVKVRVARGDSIEAAAREARYAAFRRQPARIIVLAQHQDDQAETVLLQLLRGAGVKGVAAMPAARADTRRADLQFLRPWLSVPRAEIERYAAARGLDWVQDDSNDDTYYLRNFLRKQVMPLIETRVPAYRATLARAAAQAAEAAGLLDALAESDVKDALVDDTLALAALRGLSQARARNALRYFLATRGLRMPDARRLDEALRQALHAKNDARVCVDLGAHGLRRYRDCLHVVPRQPALAADCAASWLGEPRVAIAGWGVLRMQRRRGTGIDLHKLSAQPVTLRPRLGGETLQPHAGRPRRPVKDLLQMCAVPPWQRERLPFLWSGERLVWVAGLGVDCAFHAAAGEPGVLPCWRDFASADCLP